MGVKWTDEQQKVIDSRNRNILVSAAAGSGKTAVLVERIIEMLMDTEHPVDVDRLLIVTFTEAAASEMKERILLAIEKALDKEPDNVHLQRQATLIHSALITTIHSFCLSVIREHFHVLDIDPGFRIAEEGELTLLQQDVLDKMLEECYVEGDTKFLEFTEKFGTGRNDKKIEEIILNLYQYSRSYPQPEKWLKKCVDMYREEDQQSEYLCYIQKTTHQKAEDITGLLTEASKICNEPDGPYMYGEMLDSDLDAAERLARAEDFSHLYSAVSGFTWKRLSAKKDDTVDPAKKDKVKALREKAKKMVKDLLEMYFYAQPEDILRDMNAAADSMETLTDLVLRYGRMFAEEKRNKNIIDFSDMEQFALNILNIEENGILVPSKVAEEYQKQFVEVMIDEYQDSNYIQETILTSVSTVSKGKNNIFMVGDVKQSIYRFRLSRPELFMGKYDSYSLEDSDKQRIDLHKNFRSREEVLESVNFIFQQIMRKGLGNVEYDKPAFLNPGASYEPQMDEAGLSINKAEILLVDTDPELMPEDEKTDEEDGYILEARAVAARIHELVRDAKVLDKETGEYRRPTFKDIVILSRSTKNLAPVFSAVLADEGIPAYSGSSEGYFETYEVSVILDYLRILDNFRQDLPLTAVLTSPFAGLSAAQLAKIRTTFPDLMFHEAVRAYAKEDSQVEDEEVKEMLCTFLASIDHYRQMVPFTQIHELLWKIIEETGYGVYISAMPGGAQRMANVEMLVEKASAFEQTSYKGLFNFVRYIEQLQKYDVDYGEASIEDEQSDTVRIMTIHKSKGLEFPIVFVVGMNKMFNSSDTKGSMVIHPQWGVGIDLIDLERRTKAPTIMKKIIQEEIRRENLGEELRVLYVALTRAKEKLIMTGHFNKVEEKLQKMAEDCKEPSSRIPLPYYMLSDAKCYMDWILPLIPRITEDVPITVHVTDWPDLTVQAKVEEEADTIARDVLEHWNTQKVYAPELKEILERQLGYQYPFEIEGRRKVKFTVTELKKMQYALEFPEDSIPQSEENMFEDQKMEAVIPKFVQEEEGKTGVSGAVRGTAYHRIMELLDFKESYTDASLKEFIEKMTEEGRLGKDQASMLYRKDILTFLKSRCAKRMQQAAEKGLLRKEQPFIIGMSANELYPELEKEEQVLVQGVIDVCFEEDGELVVLDYKTDRVKEMSELKERYHAQLDYYAKALEQLLNKKVKEKIIYSFCLCDEMSL